MIPQTAIIAWQNTAPWASPDQVEHDLVLTRAICELYNHPLVSRNLIFRGGTALHKLFFDLAGRFSEDLDFVQTTPGPIGDIINAIRDCLDNWLGNPTWKQNHGRFTLNYHFKTEIEPIVTRKVKIEINTREHFQVSPSINKLLRVNNTWYSATSNVLTYSLEELMATKLRALFQRKKGRDLFDLWFVSNKFADINAQDVIRIFNHYMHFEKNKISRAEFEMNLYNKIQDIIFNQDTSPLLASSQKDLYQIGDAYRKVMTMFIEELPGAPWKGTKDTIKL